MYNLINDILFEKAKNIIRLNGKRYLRTECVTSNKKLNEIYENNGFRYVREGKDYYNYTLREWKLYE